MTGTISPQSLRLLCDDAAARARAMVAQATERIDDPDQKISLIVSVAGAIMALGVAKAKERQIAVDGDASSPPSASDGLTGTAP